MPVKLKKLQGGGGCDAVLQHHAVESWERYPEPKRLSLDETCEAVSVKEG